MKNILSWSMFSALLFLLIACNNNLTKKEAEKLIVEASHFPIIERERMEHGLVVHKRDSLPMPYYTLANKGLFNIEYLGERITFISGLQYLFRVTPTPKSKEYFKLDDKPTKDEETGELQYGSWFRTCEIRFKNIESIRDIPAYNATEVKYQVIRTNFTPFWDVYKLGTLPTPDSLELRQVYYTKTNNGWETIKVNQ